MFADTVGNAQASSRSVGSERMYRYPVIFTALCAAFGLAGCTGGGASRNMGDMEGPPETEDHARLDTLSARYRDHDTYRRQWGLERVGADRAYARLAVRYGDVVRPGSGVTVGIIDTGIDTSHPAFAHTRVDEVILPGATDNAGDFFSHGTAVASVIAGGRDSSLPDAAHGVAWGASLVAFGNVDFSQPPEIPELPPNEEFLQTEYFPVWSDILDEYDEVNAAELRAALDWRDGERRVDFMNVSQGTHGIIDGYTEEELRNVWEHTIAALAQEGEAEKTVFVWAAGNTHGTRCAPNQPYCLRGGVVAASPSLEAGVQARIPELRENNVAVVAVGEDGEISRYSNRCGLAAQWCVAAPGDDINVAYFGPDPETGEVGVRRHVTQGGTSFAAPMVAGGLAAMKHLFRSQLSNTDLLARLLETADRTGRYADEKTYGRGLMDLAAATAPVGVERVATGPQVAGPGIALQGTWLGTGGAVGDSLARSLAAREMVVFDNLGAPFWHRLGEHMSGLPPSPAQSRLRRLLWETPGRIGATDGADPVAEGWETRILAVPAGMEYGHLWFAGSTPALRYYGGGGLELNAFSTVGMEDRLPVAGTELAWREGGVGFRGGWLAEPESALGTRAEGAFGKLGSNGVYFGLEGITEIVAWRVSGSVEWGLARLAAEGGLIRSMSPVATSALSLSAGREIGAGRSFLVSLAQPLRVEAGRASLSLPVGRTTDGRVVSERFASGLAPSGRQLDLSVQVSQLLGAGGALRAGAWLSFDPGHRAGARPELDLLVGYRRTF